MDNTQLVTLLLSIAGMFLVAVSVVIVVIRSSIATTQHETQVFMQTMMIEHLKPPENT